MLKKLKELLAVDKALNQYNEISKEVDSMDSKHLFVSKTFWLNVIGIATTVGGILPQKWAIPVLGVANILNRFLTNQPVTLSLSSLVK
jgi:hypothetical protein